MSIVRIRLKRWHLMGQWRYSENVIDLRPELRDELSMTRYANCLSVWFVLSLAPGVSAHEGMIEINQAAVEAGGITSGDTPGFPATLGESGSYRLTGNLTVAADVNAIVVLADHVTLDLSGFGIFGPNDCSSFPCTFSSGGNGVFVQANDVTVRNGIISGMRAVGIASTSPLTRIESVRLFGNGLDGAIVGPRSTVVESSIVGNGGMGLRVVGNGTIYSGNVIAGNFDAAVFGGRALSGNHCDDLTCSHVVVRQFLKSMSQGQADQATAACPSGFHMASLFDIMDPSAFSYAGTKFVDTGEGPQTQLPAWIRTGSVFSETVDIIGRANCNSWTSNSPEHFGTVASLGWDNNLTMERFPWNVAVFPCDSFLPSWCAED